METDGKFPPSCCKEGVQVCHSTNRNDFFNEPCSKSLEEFLKKSSKVVGGVAIGIAVVEVPTFVCGTVKLLTCHQVYNNFTLKIR